MKTEDEWVVELEQRVSAPPDEVFEYFVDEEKHRRWQGREVKLDPRPGGEYNISSAPDVWTRGTYVVVDRPSRVVITWGFESGGPSLPRGLAEVPAATSTVEFNLVADGDDTIVRVRHSGLPSDEARWAHEQGWRTYMPRLAIECAGGDSGEDPVLELATVLYEREGKEPPAVP